MAFSIKKCDFFRNLGKSKICWNYLSTFGKFPLLLETEDDLIENATSCADCAGSFSDHYTLFYLLA